MPSENQPTPPPHMARTAAGESPVKPSHALAGALLLAALGTLALAVDIYGLPLVSAWLCYFASVAVAICAGVVWLATPKRRKNAR